MPNTNIGYVALIMGIIGLRSSWRLFTRVKNIQLTQGGPYPKREVFWISASLLTYLLQGIYAWLLILHPESYTDLNITMSILLVLFGGGLVRSWELTGIRSPKK